MKYLSILGEVADISPVQVLEVKWQHTNNGESIAPSIVMAFSPNKSRNAGSRAVMLSFVAAGTFNNQ